MRRAGMASRARNGHGTMHPDVPARVAPAADAGRLWEREAEHEAIVSLLASTRLGAGGALVLQGHPGLGKSRLLDLAAENARGFIVARATGREAARGSPYAMVREAIGALLDGRRGSLLKLAQSQPSLAPLVQGRALARPGSIAPAEVAEALSWLVRAAAERDPLLLLLDDLHWCDPDSLEFWRTLANDASGLRLGLVLTLRPWGSPALRVAARLGGTGAARLMTLRPLGEASVGSVLGAAMGAVPDAALVRLAAELTGGNPLLLRELGRLVQAGASTADLEAGRDILRLRLAGLPEPALEVLWAASVLGGEFDAGLAAEMACVAEPEAALQPLLDVGVLFPLASPARCAFHHPLLRQVAYDGIGPHQRAALHRRAVECLRRRGAAAALVVPHLLALGGTDADVLTTLRAAAAEATAAGAAETAAVHLRTAAELSAPGRQQAEILLDLGRVELWAGLTSSAERFRQAAAADPGPEGVRPAALRSWGLALALQGETGRAEQVFSEAAGEALSAGACELAAECLVARTIVAMTTGMMPAALDCAVQARQVAERSGQPGVRAKAMAVWANAAFQLGDARAPGVVREAMREMPPAPPDDIETFWGWSVPTAFGMIAMRSERYAEADEVFTAMAARAARRGTRPVAVWAGAFRAELAWRRGHLHEALGLVEDASRFPGGIPWATALALAVRGRILVDTGHPADGEASLDRAEAEGVALGLVLLWARFGRAALAAHRGRHAVAADLLLAGIERADALGVRDPGSLPWHLDAAQACARCGRRAQAQRLVEHTLAQARAFGRRGLEAAALRQAAGLVGRDDEVAAAGVFRQALEALKDLDLPLERGRTLLDYGILLRQTGRLPQARQVLREAVEVLEGCGAERWRRIAEAERRGAGGRSGRSPEPALLTPQEDRIAQLVAEGHSNRQIAAHLWISPKTLETHLGHTYTKLGLRSRAELRGWVAARQAPPPR